jgi:hypothetical protein
MNFTDSNIKSIYIGIDDTDMPDTIGTGRLARMLNEHLCEKTGLECRGVTRHQLLVHPKIPYTSHNSSACLELLSADNLEYNGTLETIQSAAEDFMNKHFNPGADPGLVIALEEQVTSEIINFGILAQTMVLDMSVAYEMTEGTGIFIKELGGTGGGIIGALAAVGLRSSGNDGRFIDLAGIRDIKGAADVGSILAATPIEKVIDLYTGLELAGDVIVETRNWIRPGLINKNIVLPVKPLSDGRYATLKEKVKTGDNEL